MADIVVRAEVAQALLSRFSGFEPLDIEVVDGPVRRAGKRTPRVTYPYTGPRLCELHVTTWAHIDPSRSSASLVRKCSTCGTERWDLTDVETLEALGFDESGVGQYRRIPRVPGRGICIPERQLGGADVFRVYEFPAPVFCTEKAKEFVEAQRLTNVMFLEVGEIQ